MSPAHEGTPLGEREVKKRRVLGFEAYEGAGPNDEGNLHN
jgi:hypothetical protein